MRPRSFNGQLLLVIFGAIVLCWAGVVGVVLTHLSLNRTSTWDEKLAAIATQLLETIPADSRFEGTAGPGLRPPLSPDIEREPLVFQIWVDRSLRVAGTPDAPQAALRPDFANGAASTTIDDKKWRVYSVTDRTGRVTVQVGNLQSVVDADMRDEATHAVILATVLLLIAGFIVWVVTCLALRPVRALGDAMRHRRTFDLTPLPLDRLPRELHPLVDSFNHVLTRLDTSIEGERRFIGDAAHELRTPLSALQAQAEIALRASTVEEKDQALRKLLIVARRSTRLSEQLLDLARLNATVKSPQYDTAELSGLVQHVAQEFEVYASQHKRELYLDVQPCVIRGDVDEIGILLRNLVDNAMRYTAENGKVLMRCGYVEAGDVGQPAQAYLEVADDGPGVPEAERDAIFVRFHRVAGTPVRGSGIGLSLVQGIAELHGATNHEQAEHAIAAAQAQVALRESDHAAAQAQAGQRVAELNATQRRLARTQTLARDGAASAQQLDDERAGVQGAEAALAAARAQATAARAGVTAAQAQLVGTRSLAKAAAATIARVQADIRDSDLTAPRDGRIQFRVAQPGEVLGAGGRVLNLLDLSDVYMTFFVPETVAGRIALGSEVRLVLDAMPGRYVPATVSFVASQAQFTPRTVETASERQKLMFRVRAQVAPELLRRNLEQVKTGVPGVAWIKLDPQASWPASLSQVADN